MLCASACACVVLCVGSASLVKKLMRRRSLSRLCFLGLEVHSGWCGPSAAMVPTLKKLQWDMIEEKG
jgi:hypothetical protein